jgi:cell division protein FtsI/penicillin-binding protein 2
MINMHGNYSNKSESGMSRVKFWYALLVLMSAVLVVRLFYLQIIRHNHYEQSALRGQLKQYQIEPERGEILAHNGDDLVPLALNQKLYTLYADPQFIKDTSKTSQKIAEVIGGSESEYAEKMSIKSSRYQVLAKRLTKQQEQSIRELKLKGVGTVVANYRTYPQGSLASQLLGFVNDDNEGQYGIEQFMNETIKGTPGELKAITDASGVPLAANSENIFKEPIPGKKTLLTIDAGIQKRVETLLQSHAEKTKAKRVSALVIETKTGAIKAMANFPTYDPSKYYEVKDPNLFTNGVVSNASEVGSIMKTLTAAAALDSGVVTRNQTYYDPAQYVIDEATVRNVEEDGGPGTKDVADILQLSLNTGASWLLMQMGDGEINSKARTSWHKYLTDNYRFGRVTGVEQSYENPGVVPDPNEGFGLNIKFANTAFGQGQTETLIQMGAAMNAVLNGGTYYRPYLVDGFVGSDGQVQYQKATVLREGVVSAEVGKTMQELMQYVIQKNYPFYLQTSIRPEYSFGGKTGTAQIANPSGGYYEDKFNGTFLGYVGGNEPHFTIVTEFEEPVVTGYAGSKAAAPLYFDIANMLIDDFNVTPRAN